MPPGDRGAWRGRARQAGCPAFRGRRNPGKVVWTHRPHPPVSPGARAGPEPAPTRNLGTFPRPRPGVLGPREGEVAGPQVAMDILFLSTEFPTPGRPTKGLFNSYLLRALAPDHRVRVAAP